MAALDLGGYTVTINVADGTYDGIVSFGDVDGVDSCFCHHFNPTGLGSVDMNGNTSTPANVVIQSNSNSDGAGFQMSGVIPAASITLDGFTFDVQVSAGSGFVGIGNDDPIGGGFSVVRSRFIDGSGKTAMSVSSTRFSACVITLDGAWREAISISGKSDTGASGWGCSSVTLTGTASFSEAFIQLYNDAQLYWGPSSVTGTATGKKYSVGASGTFVSGYQAVLSTNSTSPAAIPGSIAGTCERMGIVHPKFGPSCAREKLAAARTYYVRTDGSDSNDGLADTAAGAFVTLNHAWKAVSQIDFGGQEVTIRIRAGTFTGGFSTYGETGSAPDNGFANQYGPIGVGVLNILGAGKASTTLSSGCMEVAANTDINTQMLFSSLTCDMNGGFGAIFLGGQVKLTVSNVKLMDMNTGGYAVLVEKGSQLSMTGSSTEFDGDISSMFVLDQGSILNTSSAWTISGSPSYSTAAIEAYDGSYIRSTGTFTGTATGKRFALEQGTQISVATSASLPPGNADGTCLTGSIATLEDADASFCTSIGREKLAVTGANHEYYVRADGSDSNTGLANTAGGAWVSLTYAYKYISSLDLNGQPVRVNIADGTYSGGFTTYGDVTGVDSAFVSRYTPQGQGTVTFRGNTSTPTNVEIDAAARSDDRCFEFNTDMPGVTSTSLQGFRCDDAAGAGTPILYAGRGGTLSVSSHVMANLANTRNAFSISGGARFTATGGTYDGDMAAILGCTGQTTYCQQNGAVTVTGSPSYASAAFFALDQAVLHLFSTTFSAAGATGPRYLATINALIWFSTSATIPGDTVGSCTTGATVKDINSVIICSANAGIGSEDAGAAGPTFTSRHDSASPAADDVISEQSFNGRDSAANLQEYAECKTTITDPTSGSEDATFACNAVVAGTMTPVFRDKLNADRTYYVRADGSDSNTGLANTSGGAFLTPVKAWKAATSLDLNGHTALVEVGNGTYTATVNTFGNPALAEDAAFTSQYLPIGGGYITFDGDTTTPANVVLQADPTYSFYDIGIYQAGYSTFLTFRGFTIDGTGNFDVVQVYGSQVSLRNNRYTNITNTVYAHYFSSGALIDLADFDIVDTAMRNFFWSDDRSSVSIFNTNSTGDTAFSSSFGEASDGSSFYLGVGTTASGTTGPTYNAYNGSRAVLSGAARYMGDGTGTCGDISVALRDDTDPITVLCGNVREKLTATRTYYVRTDGSDSNTGLANTSGGAWASLTKAWKTLSSSVDINGKGVFVRVQAGTYTSGISSYGDVTGADSDFASDYTPQGGGSISIQGETSTQTLYVVEAGARSDGRCFEFNADQVGVSEIVIFNLQCDVLAGADDGGGGNATLLVGRGTYSFFRYNVVDTASSDMALQVSSGPSVFYGSGNVVDGDMANIVQCSGFGTFCNISSISITGSPSWTSGAFNVSGGAYLNSGGTISGGTGKYFEITGAGTRFNKTTASADLGDALGTCGFGSVALNTNLGQAICGDRPGPLASSVHASYGGL
jgi:hypothetical protein